jgi:predicted neutral ceramidase superfamily lipid hydrolase
MFVKLERHIRVLSLIPRSVLAIILIPALAFLATYIFISSYERKAKRLLGPWIIRAAEDRDKS